MKAFTTNISFTLNDDNFKKIRYEYISMLKKNETEKELDISINIDKDDIKKEVLENLDHNEILELFFENFHNYNKKDYELIIEEIDESDLIDILRANGKLRNNSFLKANNLYDEQKLDILKEAFEKYNLIELQSILK